MINVSDYMGALRGESKNARRSAGLRLRGNRRPISQRYIALPARANDANGRIGSIPQAETMPRKRRYLLGSKPVRNEASRGCGTRMLIPQIDNWKKNV